MSYQLLSKTEPKARKNHKCIWCGELIEVGLVHVHESSKFEGDFQDHRWHPECWTAAGEFFAINGEDYFMPGEFKRGTMEEK